MYIPPAQPLSEESKNILYGIRQTLVDSGFVEAVEKEFEIQYNTYNLINSGVFVLMSASNYDLRDIDDPDDPLDEEDPFNPYDFI